MGYILIIVGIFVGDTMIKRYMETQPLGLEKEIGKKHFILSYTRNPGLAYGFLNKYKKGIVYGTFSILAGFVLRILYTCKRKGKLLENLGLSFIIGGGCSNFMDRFRKGYVIDYLIFPVKNKKLRHTVFNISDLFIFLGAMLLLLTKMLYAMKRKK